MTGLMEDGLEAARAAKSLGDWKTVADAASAYLCLHPDHAEALALKQEAEARQSQ